MKLHVGTSGYSDNERKGSFYPADIAADGMLQYYAERLPAVEINSTFYRLPKASVLETWSEQVPETFRFSIKASRRITHLKKLKDADEETGYLLRTLATLGPRLGVVLFQLPPNMQLDLDRFDAFLALLDDKAPRAAFEFRNDSWHTDDVYQRLRERGCALCLSDTDDAPDPALVETAAWGYLRLRRTEYSEADLTAWLERLRATAWGEAYVFFKDEDDGAGPALAARLITIAALVGP